MTTGIALCLSGGGYRAAIYHLGALTRLNELGILPAVDLISCVSGGSIIGAHLLRRIGEWPSDVIDPESWRRLIVEPFRDITRRNIRTGPVAVRALPWNWMRSWSTVEKLRRNYRKVLCDNEDWHLSDLPERPRLVMCATDMLFGVNWVSERKRVGSYRAGYLQPPPPEWDVARAVAASSCFPPIFPPMRVGKPASAFVDGDGDGDDPRRARYLADLRLTDGGVYDNLGLEPAMRHERVLVSYGGGALDFSLLNLPWRRLARYPGLMQEGIVRLRRRILQTALRRGDMRGTYWNVGHAAAGDDAYADPAVAARIGAIRTDMNQFRMFGLFKSTP